MYGGNVQEISILYAVTRLITSPSHTLALCLAIRFYESTFFSFIPFSSSFFSFSNFLTSHVP